MQRKGRGLLTRCPVSGRSLVGMPGEGWEPKAEPASSILVPGREKQLSYKLYFPIPKYIYTKAESLKLVSTFIYLPGMYLQLLALEVGICLQVLENS